MIINRSGNFARLSGGLQGKRIAPGEDRRRNAVVLVSYGDDNPDPQEPHHLAATGTKAGLSYGLHTRPEIM